MAGAGANTSSTGSGARACAGRCRMSERGAGSLSSAQGEQRAAARMNGPRGVWAARNDRAGRGQAFSVTREGSGACVRRKVERGGVGGGGRDGEMGVGGAPAVLAEGTPAALRTRPVAALAAAAAGVQGQRGAEPQTVGPQMIWRVARTLPQAPWVAPPLEPCHWSSASAAAHLSQARGSLLGCAYKGRQAGVSRCTRSRPPHQPAQARASSS